MTAVSLSRARSLAAELAIAPTTERVAFSEAAGRILAVDATAAVDVPGADTSAMDGYGVRAADTPGTLRVVGESRAGAPFGGTLATGEAVRISTGAPVPAGVDAVVRREEAREGGDGVAVPEVTAGRDIRRRGEVIGAGDVLLPARTRLAATAVGALGAVGLTHVDVRAAARVAIVGTGDELVTVGEPLPYAGVYDSNRHGVAAQVGAAGGVVVRSVRAGDDRAATVAMIAAAFAGADLVVTVGGVSAGVHDHVRPAMEELGAREVFRGLRVTPARPTWLGVRGGIPALALPGNPVSAAIAFRLLGPSLLGVPDPWEMRAPIMGPVSVREDHVAAVLCRIRGGVLEPLPSQASHAVGSLARADALALVDAHDLDPSRGVGTVPFLHLSAGSP